MSTSAAPLSWFAHLPVPKSTPGSVSVEQLYAMMRGELKAGVDFLVVDVRRTDIEPPNDFFIPGAVNFPAQTFQQTLPALFPLLSNIPKVIFHCSSSNGRGPRCAAWYQDHLDATSTTTSQALVLAKGIKGWSEAHPDLLVKL